MKNFKSLLPFLLMLFVWAGCDTDDLRNDVDELKNRVESLEAQVSAINDNMNVLKVLTDGKQTIQSCVYDEASNSYKLVLSDNTELTLTQGKQGTVSYPQITISQNGTWVINGEDTGRKAVGDNAPTPKFAIDANGYWTVDFGNGATQVLGADGQPVLATTSGSVTVTDEFFKDVDVVNGELVVTLQNDEVYSLPIVEALVCDIQTENVNEFKNGVLTVGYGQEVSLNVVVKGDNAFVSAPAGWTAVLGEPDAQTNIAVLTLKAPAESAASTTLGRAATADNTKDLTVQVNKGVAWAVDKIQVEAKAIISSYKALYDAGQTLMIGGVEISKDKYGEATLVDADKTLTEQVESYGVFFVNPGVTLTYNVPSTISSRRMIVIGNNELDNTACFKLAQRFQTNQTSKPEDIDGHFIWQNVVFDASALTQACMTAYTAEQRNVIFDKCEIKLPSGKNLFEATSDGRYVKNFVIQNCKIKIEANSNMLNLGANNTSANFETMKIVNNVFYAETPLENVKLFNGQKATVASVEVSNNTFVNLQTTTSGYLHGTVSTSIVCLNNLIYSTSVGANQVVFRLINNDSANLTGACSKNIIYKDGTSNWQLFYSGKMPVAGGEQAEILKVNPFDGGTFDLSTGTFVPNATYAEYGAKFE